MKLYIIIIKNVKNVSSALELTKMLGGRQMEITIDQAKAIRRKQADMQLTDK
ncbi:hypothetical protein HMPREF9318_01580 [Streptococcus urinalis FB127-CNA-2]|nr:hypothetical protein [Streptococcus urinalis]QBX12175.1 hypothetical protein JavanS644_0011 [Streptococcus satellite phage Javan644]QBX12203.1 hypothetical protein JavanS647_0011 [Streptococcus satellite phage Javan647]QBX12208.1 hypothetical protein JavanS649_0003 [Streptococcus satellite phage Javan649]EKS19184.1 hypothetical protein HMPREF9318_01580 [Streptococcus urinalis FB127-CNA-2]VEF33094.1 Uncharacterised protein [Streptococcus urinalis]